MRGTYALARVVVIRGTVARALLWIGLVGALAGMLLPGLTGHRRGLELGAGLLVLGVLVGLLHRRRWYAGRNAAAEKAGFAVTVEPAQETRQRLVRGTALTVLVGMGATSALGLLAGPAAGMLVFGLGLGIQGAIWLSARWEHKHETLVWARTEDGRLLGRRSRIAPFATTGPAAGQVRPVVRGAASRR